MILEAIVEIPKGSNYKYEISKETGELILDRVQDLKVPHNYGFIPGTLCGDGDPLDVFIISNNAIPPKTRVKVKVFGVFQCIDNGDEDDKLIGFLVGDEPVEFLANLVRKGSTVRIEDYLRNYKKGFEVIGYHSGDVASGVYEANRIKDEKA